MKKSIICITLIMAIFLVGCQNVDNQENSMQESNPDEHIQSNPNLDDNAPTGDPMPSQSIEIQSLDKLNEMRDMLKCDDDAQLGQYIQSVSNTGIQSRDDLIVFVKLIDSLPHIPILDGNITWVRFSRGISEDTGKETSVVYITTEAANGDWTRVEYILSVTDVSERVSEEKISIGESTLVVSPIKNSDEKLTLHTETRNPHPSGEGTMIQWVGEANGIFTMIHYYTKTPEDINTQNLFKNIQVYSISDCMKNQNNSSQK